MLELARNDAGRGNHLGLETHQWFIAEVGLHRVAVKSRRRWHAVLDHSVVVHATVVDSGQVVLDLARTRLVTAALESCLGGVELSQVEQVLSNLGIHLEAGR